MITMDKVKKKKIRRIIAAVCAAAIVALLAVMPLLAEQKPQEDGPQASILSGSVSTGTINTDKDSMFIVSTDTSYRIMDWVFKRFHVSN